MNSGTAKAAAILPLTAVSLLFPSISSLGAQTSSEKPNIIFILSDDLSYRDLSAYGFYDQRRAHGFFSHYLMRNGKVEEHPENYGFNMTRVYTSSIDVFERTVGDIHPT